MIQSSFILWQAMPAIFALAAKLLLLTYTTRSGNKEKYTLFFTWFLIALGIQNLGEVAHFFALESGDSSLLNTSLNLYYLGAILSLPAILAFALEISVTRGSLKLNLIWQVCLSLCVLLVVLVLSTNLIIDGYQIIAFSAKRIPGEYFFLLEILLISVAIGTLGLFIYGSANGPSFRMKMINTYMLIGIAPLVLTVVVVTLLLRIFDANYNAAIILPIAVTFFLVVTTYAIHHHKLFDIQFMLPWTPLATARKRFHEKLAEFSKNLPNTIPRALEEISSILSCPVALVGLREPIVVGGRFDLDELNTNKLNHISRWTHVSSLRKTNKSLSQLLETKGIDAVVPYNPRNTQNKGWLFFGNDKNSQLITRSDISAMEKLVSHLESAYDERMTSLARQLEKHRIKEQELVHQIEQLKKSQEVTPNNPPTTQESESFDKYVVLSASGHFDTLIDQGAILFKKPENAFKAIRNNELDPEVCIVDTSSIPYNLVRSIDLRMPCPKVWTGKRAPRPDLITQPGFYQAHTTLSQLYENIRAVRSTLSAVVTSKSQLADGFPLIVNNAQFLRDLKHAAEAFQNTGYVSITSTDSLELESVVRHLSESTNRHRIWRIDSESKLKSILSKKLPKAKRLHDLTLVVNAQTINIEKYANILNGPGVIYVSQQPIQTYGVLNLRIHPLQKRQADINSWIYWYLMRLSIDKSIAIISLKSLAEKVISVLHGNICLEDIKIICDRTIKKEFPHTQGHPFISYEDRVNNFERQLIQEAILKHQANISATARFLNIPESSLRYKMKTLGLDIEKLKKSYR